MTVSAEMLSVCEGLLARFPLQFVLPALQLLFDFRRTSVDDLALAELVELAVDAFPVPRASDGAPDLVCDGWFKSND
jgi:hypothetical protein